MRIYKITHGYDTHVFTVEQDALSYIQNNNDATLDIQEVADEQEIDLESRIEAAYMSIDWQTFLDEMESRGVSHPMMSSTNALIFSAAWNLYHIVVRLKNWSIYERPLTADYRTFMYLLNTLLYSMSNEAALTTLNICREVGVVILNQEELIGNLKALQKIPTNYEY